MENENIENITNTNESIDNKRNKKKQNKEVKKSKKIFMYLLILLTVYIYVEIIFLSLYLLGKIDNNKMPIYTITMNIIDSLDGEIFIPVLKETKVDVALVGDIYGGYYVTKNNPNSYFSGYTEITKVLKNFDFVIASLNTPIADNTSTTIYDKYNTNSRILNELKNINISALAMANDRIDDKLVDGINQTISKLTENNFKYTGIGENNLPVILEKGNVKLGILSYSSTIKNNNLVNYLTSEKVKKDVEYLKENNVDLIISYVDIPNVEGKRESKLQKESVDILVDNGVNVIIGTGSKVVMQRATDIIDDRYVYVIYSIGDFMGESTLEVKREAVIPNMTIIKKEYFDQNNNVISDKTHFDYMFNDEIIMYNETSNSYQITNYILSEKYLGEGVLSSKHEKIKKDILDKLN